MRWQVLKGPKRRFGRSGPHSSVTGISWNLLEAKENTMLENPKSPFQKYIQSVSQASLDFINGDLSEDELLERISISSVSSQGVCFNFFFPISDHSIKLSRYFWQQTLTWAFSHKTSTQLCNWSTDCLRVVSVARQNCKFLHCFTNDSALT